MNIRWIIAVALLVLGSTEAKAEPFDLRGFKLGMTLEEFRQVRHPDSSVMGGRPDVRQDQPICSDDESYRRSTFKRDWELLELSSSQFRAGIRTCNHFLLQFGSEDKVLLYRQWHLIVANVETEASYSFLSSPEDSKTFRLMQITISTDNSNWTPLLRAFREKWGSPTTVEQGTVQNKLATAFPSERATWLNWESSIQLDQRESRVDRMQVLYTHTALYQEFRRRLQRIVGSPASKL